MKSFEKKIQEDIDIAIETWKNGDRELASFILQGTQVNLLLELCKRIREVRDADYLDTLDQHR